MRIFKSFNLFSLILLFCASLYAQDAKVDITKISGNVYKLTATTGFSVNLAASIGEDGILLIDTGMPGAAKAIKNALNTISDKSIKYIINTHAHPDHFSGNSKLSKGATIIGHSKMRERLTSGMNILQEYDSSVLPQLTFNDELVLHYNGEKVKLISLPGTHSDCDIIAYFPKSKVVVVSSVVMRQTLPYIGANDGGSILNYNKILDYLLNNFNSEHVFITGHGDNCSYEDIKSFKEMVNKTSKLVKAELDKGKSIKEMQKAEILKDWEPWATGFVKTNLWIQTITNAYNPPPKSEVKESIAIPVFYAYKKAGIESALAEYDKLKSKQANDYDFREFGLNLLGYSLLNKEKFNDAIAIFKLNIKQFPKSANVYDSLGEAYEKSGDKKSALESYSKAVKLGEKNSDANLQIFKKNMERMKALN